MRPIGDPRKHPLIKGFRILDERDRREIAAIAAQEMHIRFGQDQRIDLAIYLMCSCIASERHWDTAHHFLEKALTLSGDVSFFREISIGLLEIADMEFSGATSKLPIAETALVLLTEYGLMLANHQGRSALDPKGTATVVEYISTSLLARSNINNTAMRISLIHFLTKCQPDRQTTLQLNRVISRFGHSLLEELLRGFFDDKKKSSAAFFFLAEHLHAFFSASPALATMSQDVLKHHMLKYPSDFPCFLASYCDWAPKDSDSIALATKHIALLYKAALDVYQRPLAEAISRVLLKLLADTKLSHPDTLHAQIETVFKVIGGDSQMNAPRQMLFQEFALALQAMDGDIRAAQRVVSLSRAKRGKDSQVKLAKVGDKPSPLETMLQLAG
jgi:hypothetical protein